MKKGFVDINMVELQDNIAWLHGGGCEVQSNFIKKIQQSVCHPWGLGCVEG